jgi:hypothetical protein
VLESKPSQVVAVSSCETTAAYSDSSPSEGWYLMRGNHEDSTCRNGDNNEHGERRPCSWYTHRVADSVGRCCAGSGH